MKPVFAQSSANDLLLYFDKNREPAGITAYNPMTGEELQLPIQSDIDSIRTSGDGRIAYTQDNDIWVLDVLNSPNDPINITQTPNEHEVLLTWTPDGNLLQYKVELDSSSSILYIYDGDQVFATDYGNNLNRYWNNNGWYVVSLDSDTNNLSWFQNEIGRYDVTIDSNADKLSWYVWNGQERIDLELPLPPDEPAWMTLKWTPDNHLFITLGYKEQEYTQPIGKTDIFYWNGEDVLMVDNPSQAETFLLGDWSTDGRLTLYTIQDFSKRWYIWDGVSLTEDGLPDTSTLTPINSPTEEVDDIEWMPDGRLALVTRGNPESNSLLGHPYSCSNPCISQVFLWDQQALVQVTSNDQDLRGFLIDVHDNGYIAASDFDGFWIGGVTVFDTNLESVFRSKGFRSVFRWSADGNLAYCDETRLLVWTDQDNIPLSIEPYSKWLIAQSSAMRCYVG